MDQEQVEIFELETLAAVCKGFLRFLVAVPPLTELRRDEQLATLDPAST